MRLPWQARRPRAGGHGGCFLMFLFCGIIKQCRFLFEIRTLRLPSRHPGCLPPVRWLRAGGHPVYPLRRLNEPTFFTLASRVCAEYTAPAIPVICLFQISDTPGRADRGSGRKDSRDGALPGGIAGALQKNVNFQ